MHCMVLWRCSSGILVFVMLQAMEHVAKSRAGSSLCSLSVSLAQVYSGYIAFWFKTKRLIARRCPWSDAVVLQCRELACFACFINPASHTRDLDACVVCLSPSSYHRTASSDASAVAFHRVPVEQ